MNRNYLSAIVFSFFIVLTVTSFLINNEDANARTGVQCTGMMCYGNYSCYGFVCSDVCVFDGSSWGRCEMGYGFLVSCTQQACTEKFDGPVNVIEESIQ